MNIFDSKFWTATRRLWLYQIITATVPLLIALGVITEDIASHILFISAAVLTVTATGMAAQNIKPDNVFKVGVELNKK